MYILITNIFNELQIDFIVTLIYVALFHSTEVDQFAAIKTKKEQNEKTAYIMRYTRSITKSQVK